MGRVSEKCYCAFCRSTRIVYRKRHVSISDGFLAAAAAVLASFVLWQELDPRLVVFFVVGVALAELFIVFRWRLSIACPHCGFDPVLYKKMPESAATRVKAHLDRRKSDPLSAFSPPPKLPVIVKSNQSSTSRRPPGLNT